MLLALTSCIILLQTAAGILLWDRLPDQIATHFNFQNEPDGFSSKAFTVFGMPLILLFLHWVCLLGEGANLYKTYGKKLRYVVVFIVPSVSLLMAVVCYGYALGIPFNVGRVVMPFLGVILVITGNYMPKIRKNPTMGIRLPWTLGDEENWDKTHRFAAPVWVVCGFLLIVMGLIGYTQWPAFAVFLAMFLLPMAYSFALHFKKKNQ